MKHRASSFVSCNRRKELGLSRQDIWIQTKFSGLDAHDLNNVPYDVDAPLEERVRQSLQKSLENLQTDYLDSWVMHGPEDNWDDHFKVWRTMEESVDQGKVKQLGISNFYRLEDVKWAYDHARIKPKVRIHFYGTFPMPTTIYFILVLIRHNRHRLYKIDSILTRDMM